MNASCQTLVAVILTFSATAKTIAAEPVRPKTAEATVAKRVLGMGQAGENLLRPGGWRPYEKGFQREGDWFVCDNGTDARSRCGVTQSVILWKSEDLGYLAVYAAEALVRGTLHREDKSFKAGAIGDFQIQGDNILLGQPFIFNRENIDQFDF